MKRAALLVGAAVAALGAATGSADTLQLKLADTMPAGHTIHQTVTKPFIAEVERAANGEVKLQHYPGGQLGKGSDSLRLIQAGLQDIGFLSPSHISDKMPLTAVAELPGLWSTACEATRALWTLTREGGVLYDKEFVPNGIRPLLIVPLPGYQIVLSTPRPVASLKDLAGAKLRTTGGALDLIVRGLGATPVRMTAPEMYESMSRGTLDGALFAYQAVTSYDVTELLKSSTANQRFGTVVNTYSISQAKWKSLPEKIRTVMAEAAEKSSLEGCRAIDDIERQSMEKIRQAGVKFFDFGPEDRAVIDKVSAEVRRDWAAGLDSRKKPGSEVLQAFTAALKAAS
jgi:TRAP-type C4-dicarboxylate transport system substrate-binding protein